MGLPLVISQLSNDGSFSIEQKPSSQRAGGFSDGFPMVWGIPFKRFWGIPMTILGWIHDSSGGWGADGIVSGAEISELGIAGELGNTSEKAGEKKLGKVMERGLVEMFQDE